MKEQTLVFGGSGSIGIKICNASAELMPENHIILEDYKLERRIKSCRMLALLLRI